jgi:prepilin-type processing-associated H-X9-DG protein
MPPPGDISEATLDQTLQLAEGDWIDVALGNNAVGRTKVLLAEGSLLTEAFNDGPAFYASPTAGVDLIAAQGALLTTQATAELGGTIPPPTGPAGNSYYLQDTRDWYAVHGGATQSSVNILMCDGSVKTFYDSTGDRFLNPGFPVPTGLTADEYAGIGYNGPVVELPPTEIYSGVLLQRLTKFKDFE